MNSRNATPNIILTTGIFFLVAFCVLLFAEDGSVIKLTEKEYFKLRSEVLKTDETKDFAILKTVSEKVFPEWEKITLKTDPKTREYYGYLAAELLHSFISFWPKTNEQIKYYRKCMKICLDKIDLFPLSAQNSVLGAFYTLSANSEFIKDLPKEREANAQSVPPVRCIC